MRRRSLRNLSRHILSLCLGTPWLTAWFQNSWMSVPQSNLWPSWALWRTSFSQTFICPNTAILEFQRWYGWSFWYEYRGGAFKQGSSRRANYCLTLLSMWGVRGVESAGVTHWWSTSISERSMNPSAHRHRRGMKCLIKMPHEIKTWTLCSSARRIRRGKNKKDGIK